MSLTMSSLNPSVQWNLSLELTSMSASDKVVLFCILDGMNVKYPFAREVVGSLHVTAA